MTIESHYEQFHGMPVQEYDPAAGLTDPTRTAVRVSTNYAESRRQRDGFASKLAALIDESDAPKLRALLIGLWSNDGGDSTACVEQLIRAAPRLAGLRALFIGDIVSEENECSWIRHGHVGPLLSAFPDLEHFGIRGSEGLNFGALSHSQLLSFTLEGGGLPPPVLAETLQADFPRLEHLELWVGSSDDHYHGGCMPEDFAPLFSGELFPNLRSLGLRNAEIIDELVPLLVESPLLDRIEALDLSLGTLSDAGAEILLASPRIGRLKKLNLAHHFLSDDVMQRFEALGPEVDVSEQLEAEDYGDDEIHRFNAVSE